MSISRLRRAAVTLAGIACASAAVVAQAAPMSFSVPLNGSEQVPPVQTKATGDAKLTYDPDTRVVTWDITTHDLSGPATMAHFHGPATEGKNAPPVVWLSKKGSTSTPITGPIEGKATLSEEQAKELMAGELYINVHTKEHPDGEIRGQVMPPKQ